MGTGTVVIVGGGTSGLSAAYTLKKHGIRPIVLEANDRVGGRMGGDRVEGFCLDEGADFLTPSHDVALRLCGELGLNLIPWRLNLAWYRKGRFLLTRPILSPLDVLRNTPAYWTLGMLSPGGMATMRKLAKLVKQNPEHLSFGSASRVAELDGEDSILDYLDEIGAPKDIRVMLGGFLEMTMSDLGEMGAAYAMTYFAQIIMRAPELAVPEKGLGEMTHALAAACDADIRVSTPVEQVMIEDGAASGVVVDGGKIEADAVICATSATKALDILPGLPDEVRGALGEVRYSRGCRVVIGLDSPPLPAGIQGVLYPEDETPLIVDRSITLPACVPPGKSTLDLLVGRDRAEQLFPLDDDEIKRQLLSEARPKAPPGSNLPGDDEGLFTRVYRWREAVCTGAPGSLKAIADMRRARRESGSVANLFLAGDYTRMPSLNGALASGVDAADEVAAFLAARAS